MRIRAILASTLFLLAFRLDAAAPQRDRIVTTAAWLSQHLSDPDLVLLHVGDTAEYNSGHIPGARFVEMGNVSVTDHSATGLMLEMPPTEDLRHRLEALGISDRSRIVVYYGKDWVSPATRIVFTLDYAGLGDRTTLLDGGLDAWVRNGGKVTKETPPAKQGQLAPLQTRPILVDAAFVKDHLGKPGFAVVDGRASVFYDGVDTGGMENQPDRTGHIAGAHSIPFTTITDDRRMLRSNAEWTALFAKAGVKPDDTVIGYCHIGQQTTAMLFAARALGHPVLLYDGSFQDWSRHKDYPVDNPSQASRK